MSEQTIDAVNQFAHLQADNRYKAKPSVIGREALGDSGLPQNSAPPEEILTPEKLRDVLKFANEALEGAENSLRFRIDESIDRPVVSVVDKDTGDIIRQLPSEELLRIAKSIETMKGVLFDSLT